MAFLQVEKDIRLHYQSMGQGETVVLVHGLGANLAFWYMGISRLLSRHFRVVTYDMRGHGKSSTPPTGYTLAHMTDDLVALLDHLEVHRAHVVGHSFGARVALYCTARHMHRVQTLTVADTHLRALQPAVRLRDWPHWGTWKRELQSQGMQSFPSDDEVIDYRLLSYFSEMSAQPRRLAKGEQVQRAAPSLRSRDMGRRGAARWKKLMENREAYGELDADHQLTVPTIKGIRVPTLGIYGEYSHCLPSCAKLCQLIPDCQMRIVPEAGHFHPAIRPGLFYRQLRQFLDEHPMQCEAAYPKLAQPRNVQFSAQ